MQVSKEQQSLKENTKEEQELITDFSQMFKGKGFTKRMPKLSSSKQVQSPNWLLQIPAKIELTKEELCQRRMMDQRRWHSLSKTAEEKQQALAAAVSAWNYLFSVKGAGQLPVVTVKKAAQIMESANVKCQAASEEGRAEVVLSCFEFLCNKMSVKGQAKIVFKPSQPNKVDLSQGVTNLLENLKNENKAHVLLSSNKVLCPVGFEYTPLVPIDAYKKLEDIKPENLELWIITSALKRFDPSFVIKRWKHILESLQTQWPLAIDLDQPKKGPIRHPSATLQNESQNRGNVGCWIELTRL